MDYNRSASVEYGALQSKIPWLASQRAMELQSQRAIKWPYAGAESSDRLTDMQTALQRMQAEQHVLLKKIIELESDNAQLRAWLERIEPDRSVEPEVFPANALRHSR